MVSVKDFLSSLTLDQLRHAQKHATALIAKAERGPQESVYVVGEMCVNKACFEADEFSKAKDAVVSIVESWDVGDCKEFEVHIDKITGSKAYIDDYRSLGRKATG